MSEDFWLNAGRRNIQETTAAAGRCGFMRRLPRAVDWLDIALCVLIVVLGALYGVT